MEELLEQNDCADINTLFQKIISTIDEDLNDLEYMIESDRYPKAEIENKIVEIRRMLS